MAKLTHNRYKRSILWQNLHTTAIRVASYDKTYTQPLLLYYIILYYTILHYRIV